MIEIKASQHIYTHVEKKQSPHREKGFQTLIYSHHKLSSDDIVQLERRAFFDISEDPSPRKQSYPLDANRWVISQIVPLPEPDSLGRGGRYLVHNLILTVDDWRKLSFNPFQIFRSFEFFTKVEDALEKMEGEPGNIEPVILRINLIDEAQIVKQLAENWTPNALVYLGGLGIEARKLLAAQKTLALQLPEAQFLSTVELAILLTPRYARAHCSFDSYFHKCSPLRTPVWLAGFQIMPGQEFVTIKVGPSEGASGYSFQPETLFDNWWVSCIEHSAWRELIDNQELALAMDHLLNGKAQGQEVELIARANTKNVVFFSTLHQKTIEKALFKKLSTLLSPDLARVLLPAYMNDADAQWNALINRLDETQIADWLHQALIRQVRMPEEQLNILKKLANQTKHKGLSFLTAFWQHAKEKSIWEKYLDQAANEDYRFYIQQMSLSAGFSPYEWWSPKKSTIWLELFGPTLLAQDILGLVRHLIYIQRGDILEGLSERISSLSTEEQQAIKKLLQPRHWMAPKLWEKLSRPPKKILE